MVAHLKHKPAITIFVLYIYYFSVIILIGITPKQHENAKQVVQ